MKTWTDLQRLLEERAIEGETLDFKRECPSNEKIAKTMCAFANSSGGYIIYGAKYDDHETRVLTGFTGVQVISNFADRLEQVAAMQIRPRIVVEVYGPIVIELEPTDSSKVVYACYVHPGQLQPHMSAYDGRYYARSGSQDVFLPENIVEQMYSARHAAGEEVDSMLQRLFHSLDLPRANDQTYWCLAAITPLYPRRDLLLNCEALREVINHSGHAPGTYLLDRDFGYELREPSTDVGSFPKKDFRSLTRVFHNGLVTCAVQLASTNGSVLEAAVRNVLRSALALAEKLHIYSRYAGYCRVSLKLCNSIAGTTLKKGNEPFPASIRLDQDYLLLELECPASSLRSDDNVEQLMLRLEQSYGIANY